MRVKAMALALVAAGAVATTGCATVVHSSTQAVNVESDPAAAQVFVNGRHIGATPLVTSVKRKEFHTVRVELDGYQPYQMTLRRSVSGWVWGNLMVGGLIGFAVDAVSGGMYKLTPEQLDARLGSDTAEVRARQRGIYIAVVLEPEPGWERVASLNPAR